LKRSRSAPDAAFLLQSRPGRNPPAHHRRRRQRFQEIDGFGASLTDAAAWLFAKKLTPAQTDAAFKSLFSRKDGIALSFLRQPIGSSDLAVTFYSYDDLCQQTDKACTTPAGVTDPNLDHYSLAARPGVHPAAAQESAWPSTRRSTSC
jgi:O-glycosyl hydrolase